MSWKLCSARKALSPLGLVVADLKREASAGREMSRRGGDQFANQFVALRAAKERDRADRAALREPARRASVDRDVGKIGDDQIESALRCGEQIALRKLNALGQPSTRRIFPRERERFRGNDRRRRRFGLGKSRGQREDDHAAAGADVENARLARGAADRRCIPPAAPSPGAE